MRAFHTLRMKKKKHIDDFEIFTMILSALQWKKLNGSICLMTDKCGLEFVNKYKLNSVWDNIDTSLDELDRLNIDEHIFWAGAKLFALSKQKTPCVMMDLDFIVWKKLNFNVFAKQLAVIHREDVNNDVYPTKEYFAKNTSLLNHQWNWQIKACNTAFAYFGDEQLKQNYCRYAFNFMRNANTQAKPNICKELVYMVFAEQRMLAMCADELNVNINTFSSTDTLFDEKQQTFTHLWGDKENLRRNPQIAKKFCQSCVKRLKHDFPEWTEFYLQQFN